jgi:hypothetical protein
MAAAKSKASTKRRSPGPWGVMQWLILGSLALCFAVLSGCAQGQNLAQLTANAPRIDLAPNAKDDGTCKDQLRGRLPPFDFLTVGEALAQWEEAEARAVCEARRAEGLVTVIETHNMAWEDWLADR